MTMTNDTGYKCVDGNEDRTGLVDWCCYSLTYFKFCFRLRLNCRVIRHGTVIGLNLMLYIK